VFLEELVEQHDVNLLVVYAFDFTFGVVQCEVWVELGDVFGDQTIADLAGEIDFLLIVVSDWFQGEEHFANFVHWSNILLVTTRGNVVAKSAVG